MHPSDPDGCFARIGALWTVEVPLGDAVEVLGALRGDRRESSKFGSGAHAEMRKGLTPCE